MEIPDGRSFGAPVEPGADGSGSERIALAVNVVALSVLEGGLRVLLVQGASRSEAEELALLGALVGPDEPLETAARRALTDVSALTREPAHLEQLRTYGEVGREERQGCRVVSVAYVAVVNDPLSAAQPDGTTVRWEPVASVIAGRPSLVLDHAGILSDAVEYLSRELEHTAVATAFLGASFTEAQLRGVYEAVWGTRQAPGQSRLDAPNFHRALTTLSPPIVEPVPDTQVATGGRPAALYRPSAYVRESGPSMPLERPLARPKTAMMRRRVH